MGEVDREGVIAAYEDVRNDSSDTLWAVFKFNGEGKGTIVHDSSGSDYEEFQSKFTDGERAFGYVRVTTGDEMSKRAKFVLITWIGYNVTALKKAKMSTDKAFLKAIVSEFAVEIQTSENEDINEDVVRQQCVKAGGAKY